MSGRDGGTGEGVRGPCRSCGATQAECDRRMFSHPRRCCPTCKQQGPIRAHYPATSDADPASTSASEVEGLSEVLARHSDCRATTDARKTTWSCGVVTTPEAFPVRARMLRDHLAVILAAREAAAETRGRAEAGERIAQAIEALSGNYPRKSRAAAIARADSLAAPRGDGEGK